MIQERFLKRNAIPCAKGLLLGTKHNLHLIQLPLVSIQIICLLWCCGLMKSISG